jgi:hypothetical protein
MARRADRERLGQIVREAWVRWAKQQPDPKPHWLVPWEELDEPMKEVDRQIGETVAEHVENGAKAVRRLTVRVHFERSVPYYLTVDPSDGIRVLSIEQAAGSISPPDPMEFSGDDIWRIREAVDLAMANDEDQLEGNDAR